MAAKKKAAAKKTTARKKAVSGKSSFKAKAYMWDLPPKPAPAAAGRRRVEADTREAVEGVGEKIQGQVNSITESLLNMPPPPKRKSRKKTTRKKTTRKK